MRQVFLLFFFLAQSVSAQEIFLSGVLRLPQQVDKVIIRYDNGAEVIRDSAFVENQRFTFNIPAKEPGRIMLTVYYAQSTSTETLTFYGTPGELVLTTNGTLANYTLSGTDIDPDYRIFASMEEPYLKKLRYYYAELRRSSSLVQQDSIRKLYATIISEEQDQVFATFVKKYPHSPVALYALNRYIGYGAFDVQAAREYYAMLSPDIRQFPSAHILKERIEKGFLTSIGSRAPDFTQNDTLGNPVKLSAFRGKYVLLDFWASWCGPCRAENPNLVKTFHHYKDKGFTILSVSLDRLNGKANWLKAIRDDGLTWTHVSDLKYWSNEAAALYNIRSIPQNLLLDPDGIIVAKNLRGEELSKKLEEIFECHSSYP